MMLPRLRMRECLLIRRYWKKARRSWHVFFETLDPFKLREEVDVLVREIQKRSKWHL